LTQLLILRHEIDMKLFEFLKEHFQLFDRRQNCHSVHKNKTQDHTANRNALNNCYDLQDMQATEPVTSDGQYIHQKMTK